MRLWWLHEVCGSARRSFAMWLAGNTKGHIFWVCPPWMPDRLHPDGIARFVDPARVTFIAPHRAEDVLWTLEEVPTEMSPWWSVPLAATPPSR